MVKARIAITSLLLVSLISLMPLLSIGQVKATQCLNVAWGHLAPSYNSRELETEQYACNDVYGWFNSASGWNAWWAYGTDSTSGNLQSTIVYRQGHDTYASDFWVGDFYPSMETGYSLQWGWEWVYDEFWGMYLYEYVYDYFPDSSLQTLHYNFYGNNFGSNNVYDSNVLYWTNWPYSKQYFTFIWTCACGNVVPDPNYPYNYVYGYDDNANLTGPVGMPYAWLSRNDLSIDGYHSHDNSNYCYLGWNSTSLGMKDDTGTGVGYEMFVYYFYEHLLDPNYHYTIHDSLDWASYQIWGFDWDYYDNPLGGSGTYFYNEYHWINCFGNSDMSLP